MSGRHYTTKRSHTPCFMEHGSVFTELSLRYAVPDAATQDYSMTMLRSRFGKRLRYLRRLRDLTQEQLAEAVGISVEFLSNMERGVNAPSFETLERLGEVLQVPIHELFLFPES